jgi:Resolvase, N terminal domain
MNKQTRSGITAVGDAAKAIAYARVSSKEQDKEGFSIPAQQKLLCGYAQTNRLTIVREYVDVYFCATLDSAPSLRNLSCRYAWRSRHRFGREDRPPFDRSYLEEGAQLIELAHGAQRLFAKQEAQEQRRLLNFVLSNSIWNGELTATFRQPFNLIAEATAAASVERAAEA